MAEGLVILDAAENDAENASIQVVCELEIEEDLKF